MKKTLVTATLLLPLFGLWGQVWGWDGSGTSDDPYLIQTSDDWAELSKQVAAGNAYGDKYFMMSNDIDSKGVQVGSETAPFSGTLRRRPRVLSHTPSAASPPARPWSLATEGTQVIGLPLATEGTQERPEQNFSVHHFNRI